MCKLKGLSMTIKIVGPKIPHATFFIIDGLHTHPILICNLKNNKIENLCFLLPPIVIFTLIMNRNNKNNKNEALIPQYTHKFPVNIYFCSFTSIVNVTYHFFY